MFPVRAALENVATALERFITVDAPCKLKLEVAPLSPAPTIVQVMASPSGIRGPSHTRFSVLIVGAVQEGRPGRIKPKENEGSATEDCVEEAG